MPGVVLAMFVQFHVVGERHAAGVHLEDLGAALDVGRGHHDGPVEPAGPQQRRVEDLRPVGGGDHDDALGAGEAVHLGEDLVEGLLPLVVTADDAPPRARPIASISSMKMIDGATFRASSNSSRTREAPTPTIISMNSDAPIGEERHVGLAGDGSGEQGLAGAGRAGEQHALGELARPAGGTCSGSLR